MSKSKYRTVDVFFDIFETKLEQWIPTRRKAICVPHVMEDGSERIYKLFKIGVMAEVLGRGSYTVRLWHRTKLFPEPRFVFEDDEFRYYSEEQIRMASHHQRNILGDDPRSSKGSGNMEPFFQAVREDWNIEDFDPDDYQYEFKEVQTGKGDVHVQ